MTTRTRPNLLIRLGLTCLSLAHWYEWGRHRPEIPSCAMPHGQIAALLYSALSELGTYPAGAPDYDGEAVLLLKAALAQVANIGSELLGLPTPAAQTDHRARVGPSPLADASAGKLSIATPRGRAAALVYTALGTIGTYPEDAPDCRSLLGAVQRMRDALDRLAPGVAPEGLGQGLPAKKTGAAASANPTEPRETA